MPNEQIILRIGNANPGGGVPRYNPNTRSLEFVKVMEENGRFIEKIIDSAGDVRYADLGPATAQQCARQAKYGVGTALIKRPELAGKYKSVVDAVVDHCSKYDYPNPAHKTMADCVYELSSALRKAEKLTKKGSAFIDPSDSAVYRYSGDNPNVQKFLENLTEEQRQNALRYGRDFNIVMTILIVTAFLALGYLLYRLSIYLRNKIRQRRKLNSTNRVLFK